MLKTIDSYIHKMLIIFFVLIMLPPAFAQSEVYDFDKAYPFQIVEFHVGYEMAIVPLLRQYVARDGYLGAAANSGRLIISDNPEKVRFISATLNAISLAEYNAMKDNGELVEWFSTNFGVKKVAFELCVPALNLFPILNPITQGVLELGVVGGNVLSVEGSGFRRHQVKSLLEAYLGCEIKEVNGT